jgi:putative 4-mercaptohistidine N1-methyltranferase
MSSSFYESDAAVEQYLLFHYGTPSQICPLLPWAHEACGFPARCVSKPLEKIGVSRTGRALDLGCAVGRSSLELSRHFEQVIGLDFSARFIAAAKRMQTGKPLQIKVPREGNVPDEMELFSPTDLKTERVTFACGDACALPEDIRTFDLVLMANLIDRLPDPVACLNRMEKMVEPGGWLVITSPYTWLEEYTPRERWLGDLPGGTLSSLIALFQGSFVLRHTLDLPFLIREHRRKFQLSIAEATLWQRI